MGSIKLPQAQYSDLQLRKPVDQSQAILQVLGENPYAQGISQITPDISAALAKRAELRKQSKDVKTLGKLAGLPEGSLDGVDTETAKSIVAPIIRDKIQKNLGIQKPDTYTPGQFVSLMDQRTNRESRIFPNGIGTVGTGISDASNPDQMTGESLTRIENKNILDQYPNGIPKDVVSLMESNYNKEQARQLRKESMLALKEERNRKFQEGRSKEKTDIVNKFNADPGVRKVQSSLDAAANVRELATSGNPIAANAIPTYMARASGEVGNLSEADKRPFGGSQAILRRLEQALTQLTTGQISEANRQFVLDLADTMEKSATDNLDRRAKEVSGQYGQASDFLNSDQIYKTLRPVKLKTIEPRKPIAITPKKVGRFIIEVE